VSNLKKVCHIAEKYGQQIALEPLNRFESDLVNTSKDVVRMVRDIGHPSARIMLDSFHMSLEELNLRNAIELAGDDLIHLQVSENHRGIPDSGQTRWHDVKHGLQSIDYGGCLYIESYTSEVKELAGAVCIWRKLADNQDQFAQEGFEFFRMLFRTLKN
jgi:D-psicose/D-tagatose/L-ribulose 3-epimerase